MALDWSQCPDVTRSPDVVSGAWVLKGTRVPVSGIIENIEAGLPVTEIPEIYEGVTVQQAQAILHFVALSLQDSPVSA
jgi:uncharacterized protein (DUF433 family)